MTQVYRGIFIRLAERGKGKERTGIQSLTLSSAANQFCSVRGHQYNRPKILRYLRCHRSSHCDFRFLEERMGKRPDEGPLLLPGFQLVATVFLIWVISKLMRILASDVEGLDQAMNEWAFSLQLSAVFYIILTLATWKLCTPMTGIKPGREVEVAFAIVKDYLLLFVIVEMLYVGLFRLAQARSLVTLFQSRKGFIEFEVICGTVNSFV